MVIKMYEADILSKIDELVLTNLEAKIQTYDAVGDQLLKEYYMYSSGVVQEGTVTNGVRDDGRVPTLNKIANWFGRMVTQIASWLAKKHIDRTLKKIYESDRYSDNDIFEGLFVDNDWYRDNVINARTYLNEQIQTYMVNEAGGSRDPGLNNVFRDRRAFTSAVRGVDKLRSELHESLSDIRHITAINDNTHHVKDKRKQDVFNFMRSVAEDNEHLTDMVRAMRRSIPYVKEVADRLSANDLNLKKNNEAVKDQYVKFVSDTTRCALMLAQIQAVICDRIRHTIGRVHNNGEGGDEPA